VQGEQNNKNKAWARLIPVHGGHFEGLKRKGTVLQYS
jgi:hypothetical protein